MDMCEVFRILSIAVMKIEADILSVEIQPEQKMRFRQLAIGASRAGPRLGKYRAGCMDVSALQ
jgi:hypothetical protein